MLHLITCHGRIMPRLAELLLKIATVKWHERLKIYERVFDNIFLSVFNIHNSVY